MSTLVRCEGLYRERLITARKPHRCDDYPRCTRGILTGEQYLECTEFPGGDAGYATAAGHPVSMRLCCESSHYGYALGRLAAPVPVPEKETP